MNSRNEWHDPRRRRWWESPQKILGDSETKICALGISQNNHHIFIAIVLIRYKFPEFCIIFWGITTIICGKKNCISQIFCTIFRIIYTYQIQISAWEFSNLKDKLCRSSLKLGTSNFWNIAIPTPLVKPFENHISLIWISFFQVNMDFNQGSPSL